ncbi:MAG: HD domain-containing protein [Candidatus Omnitrophica bacterium]|nr:HD domain-containing protein [Candidatus Omnitrophota bacterium]
MKSATSAPSKKMLQFIVEAGMLKQVRRSGWSVIGMKHAESVADHSFRCAVIGYCLAHSEGIDPYRVLLMTLFNDIQEARITDLHKMAQRYIESETFEDSSFAEQIQSLPKSLRDELTDSRAEWRRQKTRASIVARDADILECLIQAKEYYEQGILQAAKFMKKAPRFLRTGSARRLWRLARTQSLNEWWFNLTEFKR